MSYYYENSIENSHETIISIPLKICVEADKAFINNNLSNKHKSARNMYELVVRNSFDGTLSYYIVFANDKAEVCEAYISIFNIKKEPEKIIQIIEIGPNSNKLVNSIVESTNHLIYYSEIYKKWSIVLLKNKLNVSYLYSTKSVEIYQLSKSYPDLDNINKIKENIMLARMIEPINISYVNMLIDHEKSIEGMVRSVLNNRLLMEKSDVYDMRTISIIVNANEISGGDILKIEKIIRDIDMVCPINTYTNLYLQLGDTLLQVYYSTENESFLFTPLNQ